MRRPPLKRSGSLIAHTISRTTTSCGNSVLGQRAWAAFAAKRYDLAKQHAQAMLDASLPQDPDGDLLHKGNTILGRIALIEGDVAQAKDASARVGQGTHVTGHLDRSAQA